MVDNRLKNIGDKTYAKTTFIKQYSALFMKKMQAVKKGSLEATIVHEDLQSLLYENTIFKSYYTDCGMPNNARYPVYSVVTETHNKKLNAQENFIFLRTHKGYQLIGMTVN